LFLLFSIAISLVVVVALKALSSKQPQQQQQQQQQLRKVSRFQFLFLNPLSYAVLKQEGGGGSKKREVKSLFQFVAHKVKSVLG